MIYRKIFRPVLFRLGAETAHRLTIMMLKIAGNTPIVRGVVRAMFTFSDPRLEREVMGLNFRNPVGMAAGFDKGARVYKELNLLGLGFVEVGTVTPLPQSGNPRPRLFRLPKDGALVNRMGFNNGGMEAAAGKLRCGVKCRSGNKSMIGVNIGKNTLTSPEDAPSDYLKVFRRLYEFADYFVVNVSCPNVAGLTGMQSAESLMAIVGPLLEFRQGQDTYKPVLVKISPDLTFSEIDAVLKIVTDTLVDGIVATNTTAMREGPNVGGELRTSREKIEAIGRGGLSGAPLTKRSIEVIRYVRGKIGPGYPIIGTGGVMSPEDAVAMLDAGANLVQIYTGLIYNGPSFVRKVCKAILAREAGF